MDAYFSAFDVPSTQNSVHPHAQSSERAFTRLELAAVLAAALLLAALALPVLANTKPRADRVTCLNNLRLIGRAEHIWANDHNDSLPWRVDVSEGGTQHTGGLQNNAWFNYGKMSNELATPTILACPSDPSVRVARNFSNSPAGFFNPGLRNNAVSYFIGLDTYVTSPYFQLTTASGGLAGDRNLQVDAVN